jgi:signal transduction histidine kinase/CheY-like chemotaxis protein/HPt (histidine-containing phosphotransfer) domain-containing protein
MTLTWPSRPVSLLLLLVLVALFGGSTAASFWHLAHLEDDVEVTASESALWASAQTEIELIRFLDAVGQHASSRGRVGQQEVEQRFDLLRSRTALFEQGELAARLASQPEHRATLAALKDRLSELEPAVAGLEAGGLAGADRIREALAPLVRPVRAVTLAMRRMDDGERTRLRQTHADLRRTALVSGVALVGVVTLLVVLLVRKDRTARRLAVAAQAARAEAEGARLQLTAAIESVSEGFSLYDADDRLVLCNARYRGFHPRLAERVAPGVTSAEPVETAVATRRLPAQASCVAQLDDGRWVRISNRPTADGGVISLLADITELKQRELALREACDRLERQAAEMADLADAAQRASAARSAFLAMISHEIRTPMNGVLGALGLLADREHRPEERRLLATARQSGEALLIILNDILDFTEIEAGKLALEPTSFQTGDLVDGVVELCRIQAEARGLGLTVQIDPGVPAWLHGDPGRIRQMLLNYLLNAVRFTAEGGVTVRVTNAPGPEPAMVRFLVADTGPGIPHDRRGELFSDFVQLDLSSTRRHGGTGLGLAITRRLAELMGGTVGFDSEPGHGSTFWFDLPLGVGRPGETTETSASRSPAARIVRRGRPPRILLVEDNTTNQLIARSMLERLGCHVDLAANGVEAIDAAVQRPYDVVLMDISMPVMDGLEASRRLRALGVTTPIVALTAYPTVESSTDWSAHGINTCLVKPASPGSLRQVISDALGDDAADPGQAADLVQSDGALDRDAIARLYEDLDGEIVDEILTTAVSDITAHGNALLTMQPEIPDAIKRSAHALAGVSVSVGALELAALAKRIELGRLLGPEREPLRLALTRAAEQLRAIVAERGRQAMAPAA